LCSEYSCTSFQEQGSFLEASSEVGKMQKQTLLKGILPLSLLLVLLLPSTPARTADATAASVELSSSSFLEGSPVTIRVYDVTAAGGEFIVYFTYDSSGTDTLEAKSDYANISVDLATDEDEWVYSMIFVAPTAGSYIRVHVTTSGAPATDLGAAQIMANDPEDLLPTDLIITIGVALMIILVVVSVVTGIAMRNRRR